MNGILRSGRALAGLTAVVMVLGGCGDAADRSAPDPPSSTRPAPEPAPAVADAAVRLTEYPVPGSSHPHDVAPAADGTVWYTAQATGRLGRLDPKTGRTEETRWGVGRRRTG
jgi:streptogramin lyase